jgi:MFS family permease
VIAEPPPTLLGRQLPNGLRAFGHRNYRLFWSGQLISVVGTWMESVAQGWLILLLTHDPVALGARAAAQFLPVLVLGLFGGVVADAVPKRLALIVTQTSAGLLAMVMSILVITNTVQVWEIYLLAFCMGTVNAFDMPIRQAFVLEMAGRDDVMSAVALNSSAFNAARIVGPAIAGVLIATVGLAACFTLNAISYIAVVAGLLLMRTAELRTPDRVRMQRTWRSVLGQLAEGLSYIRHTPALFMAISVVGVVSTAALNFQVLLPLLAQDVLLGDSTTYGFLTSAAGVGSLTGALILAFGRPPTFRRLLVGAGTVGLAFVGLGISRSLPVSLVLLAFCGWGTISMAATTNILIQVMAPDQLRGRALSVYTTVFAGSTPIGGLFSGELVAIAGTPATFIIAGLISLGAVGASSARGWRDGWLRSGMIGGGPGPAAPAMEGPR